MNKEIKKWVLLFPENKGKHNRQSTAETVIDFLLNAGPGEMLNTGHLIDTGHFSVGGILVAKNHLNVPIITSSVKRFTKGDKKIMVTTSDHQKFFIEWKHRSFEMKKMTEDVSFGVVNLPINGYIPNYLKGLGFI